MKKKTPIEKSQLASAQDYMRLAYRKLLGAHEPMLAIKLSAMIREMDTSERT
jgi:hypothetical protein